MMMKSGDKNILGPKILNWINKEMKNIIIKDQLEWKDKIKKWKVSMTHNLIVNFYQINSLRFFIHLT